MKGAWYASGGSRLKDLWTLLHAPYTSMVLAYVTLGATLAPAFHPNRHLGLLLAYLLGLGGAAHFLDETRGHPWGTGFSSRALYLLTALTLLPAVGIGLYYTWTVTPIFIIFVFLGAFFAFAYNLEWFGGRFHTDFWFAASWGALPFLTAYFLQARALPFWTFVMAAALAGTAGVQISLSRWVKAHRRAAPLSAFQFADNTTRPARTEDLIARPQRALKLIVFTVDLLAIALLIKRLTSG